MHSAGEIPGAMVVVPPAGMVLIPAGTTMLGSNALAYTSPVHAVTIPPPGIFMDTHHVRVEEFDGYVRANQHQAFAVFATPRGGMTSVVARGENARGTMEAFRRSEGFDQLHSGGATGPTLDTFRVVPKKYKPPRGFAVNANQPAVGVNWFEAAAYLAMQGKRLPTEEEWEFAARAGREGDDVHGTDDGTIREVKGTLSGYNAHFGRSVTAAVGMYPPNPLGLFDMAGNAWEWTGSPWRRDYNEPFPDGPVYQRQLVVRGGGAYNDTRESLLATTRFNVNPELRFKDRAFRGVRVVGG